MSIHLYRCIRHGGIAMAHYPRLKNLREDKDLTQSDIAKLLFITQQQYSLYENGYREIPVTALSLLADFYNTSVDYILGRTDDPKFIKNKL